MKPARKGTLVFMTKAAEISSADHELLKKLSLCADKGWTLNLSQVQVKMLARMLELQFEAEEKSA